MTCLEVVEFMMAYLDGELAPEPARIFEQHMSVCAECQAYLDSYKKTIALGKVALAPIDEPAPASLPPDLIKAILAARPRA